MTFRLNSPSFLQHFAWMPLRIFGKVFCSFEIKGLENVKRVEGNVIIASNHRSELDPLMIVAALPYFSNLLPLTFVSRSKEFYKNNPRSFLYGGTFFRLMGAYPAYAGNRDYEKSLTHHINRINSGNSVCIFPVGKKHSWQDLDKARGGVGYLALKTGLPIVPVKIEGIGGFSIKEYLTRKSKLTITFGKALYAQEITKLPKVAAENITPIHCNKLAKELMKQIKNL